MKRLFLLSGFVFAGFVLRVILITKLPVWLDERSALGWIQYPVAFLFSGSDILDRAHPPGYYVVLKFWAFVIQSTSYIHLRAGNLIFYILNCFLFYLLGKRLISRKFGFYCTLAYCLSGYSIIFDWQLKQYAGLVTIILLSLSFLFVRRNTSILLFSLVNLFGLLYDYGYVWYIGSLFTVMLLPSIVRGIPELVHRSREYVSSILVSFVLFYILWFHRASIRDGLEAIDWVQHYVHPAFTIPYLLGGAHGQMILVLLLFVFCITGIVLLLRGKHGLLKSMVLLGGIAFSAASYINLATPIFHVRSLQMVAIAIMFVYAYVLYWLEERKYLVVLFLLLSLYSYNVLQIFQAHWTQPNRLLINFELLASQQPLMYK